MSKKNLNILELDDKNLFQFQDDESTIKKDSINTSSINKSKNTNESKFNEEKNSKENKKARNIKI